MARKNTRNEDSLRGGAVHVPRSRGALSGVVLIALGAWGALIPFLGPYFKFAFTPDHAWRWTAARGWLEVLPGAVTLVGGLLLLLSANRMLTSLGAWYGIAGGAWFIVGRDMAQLLKIGSPGTAVGSSNSLRTLETLAFFTGLGALMMFFAASALGRLSVRSVRDARAAQRRGSKAESRADETYETGFADGKRDAVTEQDSRDSNRAGDHGETPDTFDNGQGNYRSGASSVEPPN